MQCHCHACQRRTGSAFNLAAWYSEDNVTITGQTQTYTRTGDLDIATTFYFCPTCGSNIYWMSEPGAVGVAVGCFADPDFPPPTVVIYDDYRHHWLPPSEAVDVHALNGEND